MSLFRAARASAHVVRRATMPAARLPALRAMSSAPLPDASTIPAAPQVKVEEPLNDNVPDWSTSFYGLSAQAFAPEIVETLLAPLDVMDIEMKPGLQLARDQALANSL